MSFRQGKAIVATGAGACALVAVTAGCPHSAPAGAAPDNSIVPGQAVFARTCAVCHQPTGSGVTGVFPPLAGSELVDGDVRRLMRIVLNGLQGPIRLKAGAFNNVSPPRVCPCPTPKSPRCSRLCAPRGVTTRRP